MVELVPGQSLYVGLQSKDEVLLLDMKAESGARAKPNEWPERGPVTPSYLGYLRRDTTYQISTLLFCL